MREFYGRNEMAKRASKRASKRMLKPLTDPTSNRGFEAVEAFEIKPFGYVRLHLDSPWSSRAPTSAKTAKTVSKQSSKRIFQKSVWTFVWITVWSLFGHFVSTVKSPSVKHQCRRCDGVQTLLACCPFGRCMVWARVWPKRLVTYITLQVRSLSVSLRKSATKEVNTLESGLP